MRAMEIYLHTVELFLLKKNKVDLDNWVLRPKFINSYLCLLVTLEGIITDCFRRPNLILCPVGNESLFLALCYEK